MFRRKTKLPNPYDDPFNTWVQDQVEQARRETEESWERWERIVLGKKKKKKKT